MNKRIGGLLLVVAAILIVTASGLQAQTTGRIFGQIVDAQGAAVPGVTVTASSPSLQGMQVQVTDQEGNFRFPSLPPGRYALKAELASFKTIEQKDIEVGLDRTVTLALKMEVAGVAETVQVQGSSPVVDTTSTVTGVNVGSDQFERLPLRRDFYAAARLAPGATEDAVGTSFYGSTGAENQYIIDGLNTTGVERAQKGKTLNSDFIQEVEVKSGGLPAEYGRMTGGIVNVITKSGGNTFRGSAFGFGEGGGLQSNDSTRSLRPATTTSVANTAHRADGGGELGGFIVKDKLWFFGAYNRVNEATDTTIIRPLADAAGRLIPGAPTEGTVIPSTTNRDLYAAKLTAKASASQTVNFSIMGDPSKTDGNVFVIAGPESTWNGIRKTGGNDFVGRYDGVFGSTLMLQGLAARHKEKDVITGAGSSIAQSVDATVTPNVRTGGFGGFDQKTFTRDAFRLDATKFAGDHEIKGGVDMERVKTNDNRFSGGAGQSITKLVLADGTIYYRHRFFVNDRAPGFDRANPSTWQIAVPLTTEPDSRNTSFYVQDAWKVANGVSINAGVRWEGQNVRDRDGNTAFNLKKNWAPRLGFTWDVLRNNRSKLYANWGRFFENIPMDINIRAFGGEQACFCYNRSPNAADIVPDNSVRRASLFGSSVEPADPNLRGQYIDEILGGFEYEAGSGFVVGVKFTRRNLGRVIEDFLIPSEGEYFIANPSVGLGNEMAFYDFVTTAPAPKAVRKQNSFELNARKRFSDGWQFLASAVFSKLEGNYDGTFQVSTGQLDPNINSAYDYADFLVNADGKLSNDRVFQFKLDGSYEVQNGAAKGFNVGFSTHMYSGLPLTAYGYSRAYDNWEYYLTTRGALGRGPKDYEADLHLSYPIRLGGTTRINAIADVFNLLDRQAITNLDQRYNRRQDPPCTGVPSAICNGDGGIVTTGNNLIPAGTIANPQATAPNPDFLKSGVGFTGQRSIRLGVRINF